MDFFYGIYNLLIDLVDGDSKYNKFKFFGI